MSLIIEMFDRFITSVMLALSAFWALLYGSLYPQLRQAKLAVWELFACQIMESKELTNGVITEAKNSVSHLASDYNPVPANGQTEPGIQPDLMLPAYNDRMAINSKCHIDAASVDVNDNCSSGDASQLINQPDEEAQSPNASFDSSQTETDATVDSFAISHVSVQNCCGLLRATTDCCASNDSVPSGIDYIREHLDEIVDKIVTDHISPTSLIDSENTGDCNLACAELNNSDCNNNSNNNLMHDLLDDLNGGRTDSSVEFDSDQSANSPPSKSNGSNKRKKRNSRKKLNSTPACEINGIDKPACDNAKPKELNGQIGTTKPKVIASTDVCKPKPIDSSTTAKLNKSNTSDDKRLKTSSKLEVKGKITVDSSKQSKASGANGGLNGLSPEIAADRTTKPDSASSVKCNEVDSSKTITEEFLPKTITATETLLVEPSTDRATSDTSQSTGVPFDEPNQLYRKLSSASSLASQSLSDHSSMEDSQAESKLKPSGKSFGSLNPNGESLCKICNKHVYHMEQIKAVKSVFHRSCFRCAECNKQLNVDSYSSHEGIIYCKPHFKQLFQPKAVFDNDDSKQSNLKVEDPLENLNLDLSNIRNRFEKGNDRNEAINGEARKSSDKTITRSESIHKIMQKYQSRVAGDKDLSSSDEEDYNKPENESKEEKVAFGGMSALKSQWESGSITANNKGDNIVENDLLELRQKVKSSEPLKQAYERAIQEAKSFENLTTKSESVVSLDSPVKAGSIKEKFEKGHVETESEEDRIERLKKEREEELIRIAQSEANTKEARNKFKQIEANMGKEQITTSNGQVDDVSISANELQQRFKYFENLQENQPNNAKESSKDEIDDIPKVDTAKKMLNKFKALEAGQTNGETNGAPKSPKRITPPRETPMVYENEPVADRDPNIVKSSYKTEDVIEVEPEKAKNLRAKFENWQTEIERENRKNNYDEEDEFVPHIDTTKNLRAMFESIKDDYKPSDKPRPRINRFVNESKTLTTETCYVCSSRLYPMEKMEFSGIKLHKNCFRCNKCHTPLRLDNFTIRAEKLFCIPHFKQMFMEKGNYDEGFGLEQHKDKWSNKVVANGKANGLAVTNGNANGNSNGNANGNGLSTHKPEDEPLSHDEEGSIEFEDRYINSYTVDDVPVGDL